MLRQGSPFGRDCKRAQNAKSGPNGGGLRGVHAGPGWQTFFCTFHHKNGMGVEELNKTKRGAFLFLSVTLFVTISFLFCLSDMWSEKEGDRFFFF